MKSRLTNEQHVELAKTLKELHEWSCHNAVLLKNSYPANHKVFKEAGNLQGAIKRLRLALDEGQDIYFNNDVTR